MSNFQSEIYLHKEIIITGVQDIISNIQGRFVLYMCEMMR